MMKRRGLILPIFMLLESMLIFVQGFFVQQRLQLSTIPSHSRMPSGMLSSIHQLTRPRYTKDSFVTVLHSASSSERTNSSNDEFDPELEAMKKEIDELLMSTSQSDNPSTTMSTTGVTTNYNKYIAAASALLGGAFFIFQHGQPVSSVALLKAMEKDSVDVKIAMCNGKPTLVEFYADWCESCKVMAPTMRSLEAQYRDTMNFITIDGSSPRNAEMVKIFGVDAIPHVAFITNKAEVQTALVGAVPKKIMVEQVSALVLDKPLPYEGYDAFEERSHFPLADVSKSCSL